MISIEDCIALSGLSREEVDAIMEHEHVPEIEAAAIGNELIHESGGPQRIREMLVEEIREAVTAGDRRHAAERLHTLRVFLHEFPKAGISAEGDVVQPEKPPGLR